MSKRTVLAFVFGFALAAGLFRSSVVDAAVNVLMFGSTSGVAKVIKVTSGGAITVTLN